MDIKITGPAIQKVGGRLVHYMNANNQAPLTFNGAAAEFMVKELTDTLKTLGVPCALLGKTAAGEYTGVVIAGQTFHTEKTKER